MDNVIRKRKNVFPLICWILLVVTYTLMAPVTAFAVSFNSSGSAAPNFLNETIRIPWYLPYIVLVIVSIPVIILSFLAIKYAAKGKKVPLKIKIPLLVLTLPLTLIGAYGFFGEIVFEPIYQYFKHGNL